MKHLASLVSPLIFIFVFCAASCAQDSRLVRIRLSDGDTMTGKLDLPGGSSGIRELVIFVHGTGPCTYLDRRKMSGLEFDYFALFTRELTGRGIAFFTYSRRGVTLSNTPPTFDTVDRKKFQKYLPSVEVKDIGTAIGFLKKEERLKKSKIVLLGWSEGTILAPMIALDKANKVDALLLAGYANDNMTEIIKWQLGGGSSMINFCKYLDADSNGMINRAEYESTEKRATSFREKGLKNAPFSVLDANKDSLLTAQDFWLLNSKHYEKITEAFEKHDDDWIWNNYFHVTSAWYAEHKMLEANNTRLMKLDIPIYIFQGMEDASTPASGAIEIQKRFAQANKTNLHCFFFPKHNHDLNYTDWPLKQIISPGLQKIFETMNILQTR
ncbi:MAG: alpha/beta fold hydrolase [Bacteroidota bacterium]